MMGLHQRAQLIRGLTKKLPQLTGSGYEIPLTRLSGMAALCFCDYPDGKFVPCSAAFADGDSLTQWIMMPRKGIAFLCGTSDEAVIEAIGPAILSGLPCLLCSSRQGPATDIVCAITDQALLPDGALQHIPLDPVDIAPHLTAGDVVCLLDPRPCSAALSSHPLVFAGKVSLEHVSGESHLAVLGPDLTPGSPEFRDFVKRMTVDRSGLGPDVHLPRALLPAVDGLDLRLTPYDQPEEVTTAASHAGQVYLHLTSRDGVFLSTILNALAPYCAQITLNGKTCSGERDPLRFMARTTISASADQMTRLTGIWHRGATVRQNGHPFRKSLEQLAPGDRLITPEHKITCEDVERFAHLTGDHFYAHMNAEHAKTHPFFEDRVAHGQLIVSIANGLLVDPDPGPVLANLGCNALRFHMPVYFGTSIHVEMTCRQITPRPSGNLGEVRWDCRVLDDDDKLIAEYELLTLVSKQWPPE